MVTEVAGDLVDRHGAEALTLALVAKEVGVATPSLYKHVGGLDDLRSRVSAAATIQLSKALAEATVGLAGRDALVALASTYRSYAAEHPGLYPLTQVTPTSDDHRRAASETVAVVAAAPQRRRDRSGASYRRHPHGEGGTARLRRPRVPRGVRPARGSHLKLRPAGRRARRGARQVGSQVRSVADEVLAVQALQPDSGGDSRRLEFLAERWRLHHEQPLPAATLVGPDHLAAAAVA